MGIKIIWTSAWILFTVKPIFYSCEKREVEHQRLTTTKKSLALHLPTAGGFRRSQVISCKTGGTATSAARKACEASPFI
jgi:hypothetical protein